MKFKSVSSWILVAGLGGSIALAAGCSKPSHSWAQDTSLDPADQAHRDQAAALSEEDAEDLKAAHRKPKSPVLDRSQRQHVIDQPRIP